MPDSAPEYLEKQWVRSHEEERSAAQEFGVPSAQVYRPSDFKFPPSRGRTSMMLAAGGTMSEVGIGATDRQVKNEGRWILQSPEVLVLESPDGTRREFTLLSIGPDRLVMTKR